MIFDSSNGPSWIVALLSLGLVPMTVLFHYEVMSLYSRWLATPRRTHRARVLYLVFGLLFMHSAEILMFAAAYWGLGTFGLGELRGLHAHDLGTYFYYSGVVYTTLGFGDIVPTGPTKILTAVEALAGLSLITWSASFTFLEMQRYWQDDKKVRYHVKRQRGKTT